ncbi:MAG: hypothetical protein KME29_13170 [Calothrix sp. FI2-JRJ7]|nr:hypothetical protein [Calothrix sp. FI2-JRJ7]
MEKPRQLDIFSDNGIEAGEPRQLELPLVHEVSPKEKKTAPPSPPPGAQLSLFPDTKFRTRRQKSLLMDVDALQRFVR